MTASIALTVPNWTLGDRLRKAREHAGLEQGELASRVGISRNTVSNYELGRGQRPPKVVILRAWATECGVPYEWIVDGFRRPTPGVSSPYSHEWMSSPRPGYSPVAAGSPLRDHIVRFENNLVADVVAEVA